MEKKFDWWACPNCGWNPPDEMDLPKSAKFKYKGSNGKKYPRYEKFSTNLHEGISIPALDWTETHFCPKCKKEFSFSNANY